MWGQVLKDRRRESFVLATKVFAPMGLDVNERGLSRKAIFEQCHASLRRLQTDHIDRTSVIATIRKSRWRRRYARSTISFGRVR